MLKKGKHSEKNFSDRVKFAREHSRWNLDNWRYIIFSDESDLHVFPVKSGKLHQWFRND